MESPWGMLPEQKRIADYTDMLAAELEKDLAGKKLGTRVNASPMYKNSGFIISLHCGNHSITVMVSGDREKQDGVVINRDWYIGHYQGSSSPDELRKAADVYDGLVEFLDEKFGKPASEHDNRSTYFTLLEQTAAAV